MKKRVHAYWVLLGFLLLPGIARAGEWRVTPIRLVFDRGAKSGVVTVSNEGDEKIELQMSASVWTQDAEGKDRYAETNDLVFFPKIMTIESKQERILRAGIRIPATKREKTYRLFIEEIPGPRKGKGANVSLAIRFGLPIFVKPLKGESKGEIDSIGMTKGVIGVSVRNTGNEHFVIHSVIVTGENAGGEPVFSRELSGWYLLAEASRRYSTEVPREVCPDLARITLNVKTDLFSLSGEMVPEKSMCPP
ncbi:MAG: P pilus assembly protein, chaperone PapD, fimbrial chaperone protein [Deltaproteobacteria bacterium CSP1-8]|nr:MAG: P pilus assembly protein, chaperone PapD, fimbrial chaperone protein [Deltaproteobacteria bacterium CSP1-8]